MTNFSGKPLSPKTGNAACRGPQGGGMDSRRNGVAEISPKYLAEVASNAIPSGYKQTEVGVIPEDWEVVTLGDIGQTVIGLTYSPNDVADFGTLVLRSSNVQNGKLAYADNVYVNMELPERVIVKQGDILICVRNGSRQLIGKCALIDENAEGSAFGAFMSIFRTKYSVFVFYQFQSDLIQNQINEIMGATINQITNKDMSGFKITLPSDEKEQTAIANALSDVDALISELEKLIAKKQAIKTATMQQLLTGRTRLPQFALREDGTPKGIKPSELGEIPEDWEVGAIGDSCRTYSGGTPSTSNKNFYGGGIKWITSSDLNQGVIHDVAGRITDAGLNGSSAKLVEAHTLLIALYGATAGVCAITRISAAINQAVLAIVPAEHNSEYLFYWFTRHKEVIIETYTQGGQPNLSGDIVRSIKLAFPPVNEQTAIATILSDMDAEIQALEQRLGKTRHIKQGMMQELLTGKTRLVQPSLTGVCYAD
ncbi:restriction endonuclease subunit S [Vibrio cholerae]|uniref:restriction endonuclease subunit S n=1 Tax=Vibrio cholerae TaxID=666 RepID=UPI002D942077|nr:restriction endonuclease subunit S [Vibrio cholerae]MEB5515272.1 restriction endonuclease subunit S [Vibrio cholerae]